MNFTIKRWGDDLGLFVFIQPDGNLVSTDNPEVTAEEAALWYINATK